MPEPGFKPRSPALQADSLPLSHQVDPLVSIKCLGMWKKEVPILLLWAN